MASFRFAVALVAMALVAAPTVKANDDLTVGSTSSGKELGSKLVTRFSGPLSVEVLPGDEIALVADEVNNRIVSVSLVNGDTTEYLETGTTAQTRPRFLAVCDDGVGYFSTASGIKQFDTSDTSPTASQWVSGYYWGLACLTNSTHDLLFAAIYQNGIRAYDRSNGTPTVVWEASDADLGHSDLYGISLSPDLKHLAFAVTYQVGSINLETKKTQLYGTGTFGTVNGAANDAKFYRVWDVAWTPDGHKILATQRYGFKGLRLIDFATGAVSSSDDDLIPSTTGRGVAVMPLTGEVVVTYSNGLKKMAVDGVNALPSCGNVPTVGNSDGGNNATAVGFVGDTVTFVCDAGLTAAGSTSQITTCQSCTLTWSPVSDCQSDADFIIAFLGNKADVDSTLKAVVKAFDNSLCGAVTPVTLHRWCQLRALQ